MGDTHYTVIDTPNLEIGGRMYTCENWHMSFNDFIQKHAGREIYIYRESLGSGEIRAIVLAP